MSVLVEQPVQTSVIEKLQQWELAGGKVRIACVSHTEAVVELCTCTGELMERFASGDQAVLDDLRSLLPMAGLDDTLGALASSRGVWTLTR